MHLWSRGGFLNSGIGFWDLWWYDYKFICDNNIKYTLRTIVFRHVVRVLNISRSLVLAYSKGKSIKIAADENHRFINNHRKRYKYA